LRQSSAHLVARFHQLVHQLGCCGEHDAEPPLAGVQAEAQGDVALAGAAVAKRDDVLAPQDVFAARQFEDQHLVEAGNDGEHRIASPNLLPGVTYCLT